MLRFALFVDYSNLFGVLKALDLKVTDFEAFFHHLFARAAEVLRSTVVAGDGPPARLQRVYWYAVGGMEVWDFTHERARARLFRMFERDREVRRLYLADARQRSPGDDLPELTAAAFVTYADERRTWYADKSAALDSMRSFYQTIQRTTRFIEVKDVGAWKVDVHHKSVVEKGVDTALAVDMVTLCDTYDAAVLISGDADMIPSVEYAKSRGRTVAAIDLTQGSRSDRRPRSLAARLRGAVDYTVRVEDGELVRLGFARRGIG